MAFSPQIVTSGGPALLPEERPLRVCMVLLSGIGDVVHGLPLAADLKSAHPGAHLTWIAEPAPAEVLRHHPAVDRVVVYRSRDGLRGVAKLAREMRGERHHVTLNLQRYFKSLWPTLLSRAPVRVGMAPSKTRDGIRLAHTHVLEEGPWKHTQDLFLDFRAALGVARDAPVRWDIPFTPAEDERREAFFRTLDGRPVAALVVASANHKKDWPADRMAVLADALDRDLGYTVVLVGGPSEREAAAAQAIRNLTASHPVNALGDSVRHLMGILKGSALVIAPDTGPLHLAHAMDVPVVGLFGHTNPWRVGPWRKYHDLVVDRYTDAGELPDPAGYLPKDGRMAAITVAEVLEKVEVARCRYP